MLCATRLSLRALTLTTRRNALASVSSRRRGALFLLIALSPLRLLVGGMAVEGARRRELAELVADHVLGDQHRDELVAVIDAKGQADELREDRRAPRPRLDDLVAPGSARLLGLFQEVAVDERPLPYRACHLRSPLLLVAPAHDVAVGRLVVASLLALGRFAPRGHRVAAAPRAAFVALWGSVGREDRGVRASVIFWGGDEEVWVGLVREPLALSDAVVVAVFEGGEASAPLGAPAGWAGCGGGVVFAPAVLAQTLG